MNDLIRLVKEMRALQKRFFDGDKSVLSVSKKAEKAVDAEILRLDRGESFLPGLEMLKSRGDY